VYSIVCALADESLASKHVGLFVTIRFQLLHWKVKRYSYPCNRLWRPIGLSDIEAPRFSKTIRSQMAVRLSTSCHLPPGRFLVLISVGGWVDLRAVVDGYWNVLQIHFCYFLRLWPNPYCHLGNNGFRVGCHGCRKHSPSQTQRNYKAKSKSKAILVTGLGGL
jgi:hypothetical protein